MKRVLFAFVFASILLSFGLVNAMTVTADIPDGGAFWDDGGTPTLKAGNTFVLHIMMDNPDADRVGMSIPFTFYMTGDATTWGTESITAGADPVDYDFGVNGCEQGSGWWALLNAYVPFGWNGTDADTVNWTGSGLAGMPGGSAMDTRFEYPFTPATMALGQSATFCVDSCSIPGQVPAGKYDWLFEAPSPIFGGPYCWPVGRQPNENAYFTNCPTVDIAQDFDIPFAVSLNATETEGDTPYTYAMVSGPGAIDAAGQWTFAAGCGDVGSHTVVVGVHDTEHAGDFEDCSFTITVGNTGPAIGGDCGATLLVGTGTVKTLQFTATDPNTGDVLTFSVVEPTGLFTGTFGIDANTGLFSVSPLAADEGTWTFTAVVTDCDGATATCDFTVEASNTLPFKIVIEKVHDQLQGHHAFVDVYVEEGTEVIVGFDFLIGYDPSVLAFVGASFSAYLETNGWEYLTYRYNYNGNCGNGCPSGLLRVVGIAEYNDGPSHPTLEVFPAMTTLFTLDFLVSSDYNVGGMFAPVSFYWMDCGDNAVAFYFLADGMLVVNTGLSKAVFNYDGTTEGMEITDMYFGFPTFTGTQWECFQNPMEGKPIPIPWIDFYNGGVDIIHPSDIDDRGDVNLNGVANEIADAVVFTNYFIYGYSAFNISFEGQKAATEINGDGIALTVADLVYLIRVIVGDAMPLPKENPNIRVNAVANGSSVTVDNEIGAAYFTFAGNVSVTLADGANGMELKTGMIDGNTVALVYSFDQGVTAAGEILSTNGELISVDAADYNGITYKTVILPANFSLTNYPNPFNPATVIELRMPVASDYTIDVYNVLGQRVANYSGNSEAGVVAVNFDGTLHGSGVYFYRAQAGSFSATEKMVMLK